MERDINTLDLISRAYDHMMLLYKDSDEKIHYSDEFDKLFNKILDQKISNTNIPKINSTIKDFIGDYDHQVENLNKKEEIIIKIIVFFILKKTLMISIEICLLKKPLLLLDM